MPGRPAFPGAEADELLPRRFRRERPPRLPEVSEPELVRHYVRLSKRNFDLDSASTARLLHDEAQPAPARARRGAARARAPASAAGPERAQGALELMWRLQAALAEIAGLPHVSLQPSAGSHGELAGCCSRAPTTRTAASGARSAHAGHRTRHQPATVTMAGLEVVKLATTRAGRGPRGPAREGRPGRRLPDAHQPEHARLFDPNIEEIAAIVHEVGPRCTTTAPTSTP